ncbi:MAG: histidine kinase, partial [Rhizobiales bacterium]|nr:histidine kinase [Hyphomicrobiales bacterium]
WVVNRVLSPVRALAADLRARDARTATDPLPLGSMPDEILPLGVAMNELVARLHQQLEFRRRFISDAAHELRTPLTALRLQASNLRRQGADGDGQALLLELDRGLRRMSELTGQLLDLARAETPDENAVVAAVNIQEPISKALEDVVPLAHQKGIDLGVEPFQATTVLGDANDIRILLKNLLDNAVRYTPEGGTIDIAVRPDGGRILLSVTDNGQGIDGAALDRIFDRFFRAPGAAPGGSGLGLAIARALADRLQATLEIRNRNDVRGVVASVWMKGPKDDSGPFSARTP